MNIALLKPPIGGIIGLENITFVEPLGLECVAACLEEAGHRCTIIDLRIDGMARGLEKLAACTPRLVGIQCNFTTERFRTLRLAAAVKERHPEATLVVGGHDASRVPGWFSRRSLDAICIGDGEEVMPELAAALQAGRPLQSVPGLFVPAPGGGGVDTGPAASRRPLDALPLPARHLIDEYWPEYYINFHKPMGTMETARGCPYRCNYCSVWQFHEKSFREKSPERVVEELAAMKAPNVLFTDDIFWLNHKRARAIAAAIKASGIQKKRYIFQTRSDIVCRHPELVEIWRELGRITLFLGLEAITDEALRSINKNNKARNNDEAIRILQQTDAGYAPNFIVDPSWGVDEFSRLKDWISQTGAYNSGFTVLTPLPGTQIWDAMQDQVTTRDWELYDLTHAVIPTRLPREQFYEQYAGLWAHTTRVRYQHYSPLKDLLVAGAALASRRVSLKTITTSMNMVRVMSRPESFLRGHDQSAARMEAARALL